MRRFFLFIAAMILLSGCSEVYNTQPPGAAENRSFRVVPFANFTQTPMAGYRAASIAEGVLKSKVATVKGSLWDFEERDYTFEEIKKIIKDAKDSDYVVTGYVNEFRYKTGIDGEPAVSVTIKVYDTKEKRFIWRGVASKTGWSYESVGTIAQESIEELVSSMLYGTDKNKNRILSLF